MLTAHILGYLTLFSIVVTTGGAGRWLWAAGTRVHTWQRRLPIPVPTAGDFMLSPGSDYVGAV